MAMCTSGEREAPAKTGKAVSTSIGEEGEIVSFGLCLLGWRSRTPRKEKKNEVRHHIKQSGGLEEVLATYLGGLPAQSRQVTIVRPDMHES